MKKQIVGLSLSLLLGVVQYASAGNYYWTLNSMEGLGRFSDPTSACQGFLAWFRSGASKGFVFNFQSIVRQTNWSYTCTLSYSGPNVPLNTVASNVARFGDGCQSGSTHNPNTGLCETTTCSDGQCTGTARDSGVPPKNSCAGNPINIINGNKFQTESDYAAVGPSPLALSRSYNSIDGLWRHSYSTSLLISASNLTLVSAQGQESYYTLSGTTIIGDASDFGRLKKLSNGWNYLSENGDSFSFNESGRLVQQISKDGVVVNFTYSGAVIIVADEFGESLTLVEDPLHQPLSLTTSATIIQYSYNANGRLAQLTRTRGGQIEQRQFHYEDARNNGLLTGITDERGIRFATWTYDDIGRATSSEHADGAEYTQVAYNTDGSRTVTNELGKSARYSISVNGNIKRVTSIEGEPSANCPLSNSSFSYDYRGLRTMQTDKNGALTLFNYNDRGLETSRTEARGTTIPRTTSTTWHATKPLPLTITTPTLLRTYTYDDKGHVTSQTDSAIPVVAGTDRTWTYTYNAQGLLQTADGPRTDVADITTYAYDSEGHLTAVTNPLGHVTTLSNLTVEGRPQTLTDANGATTTLAYTPQGWLASMATGSSTTGFEYNAVGDITKTIRGDGSWLAYTWDDARRLTAISNNLGEREEYDLDAMGNRTALRRTDSSSSLTLQRQWVHDELGRVMRSVGAAGQISQQQYDLNDNPTVSTNPRNYSTTQAFDLLNRLATSTDALNGVTTITYNAQDNPTEVKDPKGVITTYGYNGFGDRTSLVSKDSGTTKYAYDTAGNLTQLTDARSVITTYTYDALNRVTARSYPANPALNISYYYDMTTDGNKGIGRLTGVQDASGVLGYVYDSEGNLTEQLRSVAVNGVDQYDRLTFTYDGAKQLTSIRYPMGFNVAYPRNAGGQVSAVQLQIGSGPIDTLASNISYLPFGPVQNLTWGNGLTLSRSYDQDYRLTTQSVGGWASTYGYDANSNIAQQQSSLLGDMNYTYDALDRLTEEKNASLRKTYSYDAVNNRTTRMHYAITNGIEQSLSTQTLSTSLNNRLYRKGSDIATHDANGNLTKLATRIYNYDQQNRLLSAYNGTVLLAEFRYNALGQRTHKITPLGTTTFLYGPNGQLLGEQQFTAQGIKQKGQYYIWLDNMPLAGVSLSYDAQGVLASSTPFYLHGDHLNTPRMATNAAQQTVWQWQSDAFGVGTATGLLVMNLRFPGQYYDQETGLHYNYFRDYDPDIGRYVESDPIELEGGLNTYGYAGQNPVMNVDPDGQFFFLLGLPALGMGAGAGAGAGMGTAITYSAAIGVGAWGISMIGDPSRSETKEQEQTSCPKGDNSCPPCEPPVGTVRYRVDLVPPSKPHYPHAGSHVHLYERHQSPAPTCKCFWHPVGTTELPPPPNMSPME